MAKSSAKKSNSPAIQTTIGTPNPKTQAKNEAEIIDAIIANPGITRQQLTNRVTPGQRTVERVVLSLINKNILLDGLTVPNCDRAGYYRRLVYVDFAGGSSLRRPTSHTKWRDQEEVCEHIASCVQKHGEKEKIKLLSSSVLMGDDHDVLLDFAVRQGHESKLSIFIRRYIKKLPEVVNTKTVMCEPTQTAHLGNATTWWST